MTLHTINARIHAAEIDKELSAELRAAYERVTQIQEALLAKFRESGRYQAAKDIAGRTIYGKKEIFPRWEGHDLILPIEVQLDQPPPAYVSVDSKTINVLLSGKILTNAEKRSLLKAMNVPLDDKAQDEPAP